jgi:hypothetical protein
MKPDAAKLSALLLAQLTPEEREHGVVYQFSDPVESGTTLKFPRCTIRVPWNALLAFIDREPLANWGHSARFILINRSTGETMSVEARFPPFRKENQRLWRVAYQAPTVPDTALAVPK